MKRRRFLRIAAVATLTGGLGQTITSAKVEASTGAIMLADNLLRMYSDRESASIVGNAFLRRLPNRPRIDHVVQGLIDNLDISTEKANRSSPSELRDRLKGRTSKEFDLGQTAEVQGWVLGNTEAWLCALAALRRG